MTKKITFIGAGSTIFMKNIIGDALHYPALSDAHIALMDIDAVRLEESATVATKLIASLVYLRYSKRRYLRFYRVFNSVKSLQNLNG